MMVAAVAAWFFVVFSMGAYNGDSYVRGRAIDRIVLPTKEACEAARQGMEEYETTADKVLPLYEAGPCQPVPQDWKDGDG